MARVLVVDDSGSMRGILRRMLVGAGHDVIGEAEDGLKAVELFKALEPDVTTMDIVMPRMDGLEALKIIMESDPSAAVVMVTSMNQMKDALQAAELGATGYVLKPFERDKVIASIKSATERAV